MPPEAGNGQFWINLIAAVIFFGGAGTAAFYLHERKNRQLQKLASKFGLAYDEHASRTIPIPSYLDIGKKSAWVSRIEARRLVHGEINDIDLFLFELRRFGASDQSFRRKRVGYPAVVGVFIVPGLDLPRFDLRPEKWRHRISDTFQDSRDIDFSESPRFSRRYHLSGKDEDSIRNAFSAQVREFWERNPGYVAQGFANELVLYRPPRLFRFLSLSLKKREELLETALEAIRLFRGKSEND